MNELRPGTKKLVKPRFFPVFLPGFPGGSLPFRFHAITGQYPIPDLQNHPGITSRLRWNGVFQLFSADVARPLQGAPRSENSLLNSAPRNFRSSIRVASHFFTVQPSHHLSHSDNRLAKESGDRERNLLRDREALAGCRGAAMTVILSITRKVGDTGIASCKQKNGYTRSNTLSGKALPPS